MNVFEFRRIMSAWSVVIMAIKSMKICDFTDHITDVGITVIGRPKPQLPDVGVNQ